jgi:hypothetical protein
MSMLDCYSEKFLYVNLHLNLTRDLHLKMTRH